MKEPFGTSCYGDIEVGILASRLNLSLLFRTFKYQNILFINYGRFQYYLFGRLVKGLNNIVFLGLWQSMRVKIRLRILDSGIIIKILISYEIIDNICIPVGVGRTLCPPW